MRKSLMIIQGKIKDRIIEKIPIRVCWNLFLSLCSIGCSRMHMGVCDKQGIDMCNMHKNIFVFLDKMLLELKKKKV